MKGPVPQQVDRLPAFEELAAGTRHCFLLRVVRGEDAVAIPVNVFVGAAPRPRLVAIAGVHGNEYDGITALAELWDSLDLVSLQGTLVAVPVANPPAFWARRRRNPADDVDMNRVFPGDPRGTITHRIAHRLFHDVVLRADFLLSMHGWTADGMVVPYVEYPAQGALRGASRAAAIAFGLDFVEPFEWLPGLLVAAANRAGIPAIEPEIGGQAIASQRNRALYRRGLHNLLQHLHMVPNDAPRLLASREVRRTSVTAPSSGIVLRQVDLEARVASGQELAVIIDENGVFQTIVRAPSEGIIAAVPTTGVTCRGDDIFLLFHLCEGSR